jgi:Glucose/sorbosone dehydrogenases
VKKATYSWIAAIALLAACSSVQASARADRSASAGPATAGSQPLERGTVRSQVVATGLDNPAGFTVLPNGNIVYLERTTGRVRLLDPSTDHDRILFTIAGVNGDGERGALGVAAGPQWPSPRVLWVYVTRQAGGSLRNQVMRIPIKNGHGTSMKVLLSQPASSDPYHNGGRILFGPDKKLYVFIGDGHNSANAQNLSAGNLRGKLLRINPNGSVPSDNPIGGSRVFSFGHRNSYGFIFDPATGFLWETENGPECNDEINRPVAGENYAWGSNETCDGSAPGNTNNSGPQPRHQPEWFTGPTIGITGDAFCNGCGVAGLSGKLLVGANNDGILRVFTLNAGRDAIVGGPVEPFTSSDGTIYSMEVGPTGSVYFSTFRGIYRLT